MKKLSRILEAGLILWFALATGVAHATTSSLTFTDNTGTGGNFDTNFVRFVDNSTTSFSDHWTFSLTSAMAGSGGSAVSSGFGSSFYSNSINFTNYQLVDTTDNVVVSSGSISYGNFGFLDFAALDTTHLYDLTVEGMLANGFSSGLYGGILSISPVPEPLTYIMLLAGLSVVGFTIYRRKYRF